MPRIVRRRRARRPCELPGVGPPPFCSDASSSTVIGMRIIPVTASLTIAAAALAAGCECGGLHARGDGSIGDGSSGDVDGEVVIPGDVVLFTPGTPMDAPTRFEDPVVTDTAETPSILYPLDGVLFPRNVYSPDVQWDDPGVDGDVYRVRFTGAPVTLTIYVAHTGAGFRWDYLVDYEAWRRLAGAAAGGSMQLEVDRWIASRHVVVESAPIRVGVARGSIAGAVYFWALGEFGGTEGRILRVRQGTETAPAIENFMPSPPAAPDGERCAACHGLSRDGNHLAVSLDDGTFGGVVDLTEDLSGTDPPMLFRFDRPWFFAAFDPTGARLVMTDPAQGTFVLDGATGAEITRLRDGTHPAWSPDGTRVVLVIDGDDAWNPSQGNLASIPVTGPDTFGAAGLLHGGATLASAPEGGSLDAYPTFSPDSRFVVFQHGTRTLASAPDATGALYAVPSGGGEAVRLDHASEGGAWYPNFTPFVTNNGELGSMYWVLLYSRRDYGNALAGTRGTGRRQIWVAAVSTEIGASDPSFVPYWLPGQETAQENASAYWAPVPCRLTGEGCRVGGQCCSAECGPDPVGTGMVCMPPPRCREAGETCGEASDCCGESLLCEGGVCLQAPF